MGFIISTFRKYFFEDLPLIITSFICMYFVVDMYLNKTRKNSILSWLLIEGFEHLVFPIILIGILVFTQSRITAVLFHAALVFFFFVFLGKIIVRANTKQDWLRVFSVMVFSYFFIFLYPHLMILAQMYTPIKGVYILPVTILCFYAFNRKLKLPVACDPAMNPKHIGQ